MRRCAIRQCVYEIAKPTFDLFWRDAQNVENLLLDVPLVDSDTSATDLVSVAHEIVVLTLDLSRICV